jgi:hypothetical protein
VLAGAAALGLAGSPARADTTVVSGKVTGLSASHNELTVRTAEGRTVRLRLRDDARVLLDGKPARLSEFKEGTVAVATCEGDQVVRLAGNPDAAGDVRKEVREAVNAIKASSYSQKEKARERMGSLMRRLDERIDALRVRAAEAGPELREKYKHEIEVLQQKRAALRKRLEKVREASPEAWEDIKAGVSGALDDLGSAFERAWSRFKR